MIDASKVIADMASNPLCVSAMRALESDFERDPRGAAVRYRANRDKYLQCCDAAELWHYTKPNIELVISSLSDQWETFTMARRINIYLGMAFDLWLDEHAQESASMPNVRGRKPESLFAMADGSRNDALTQQCAEQFTDFLRSVPTKVKPSDQFEAREKGSYITLAFIEFYYRWRSQGWVLSPVNGRACYRFLKEDCARACGTTEKNFSDWLKRRIDDKKYDIVVRCDVDLYFEKAGLTNRG